MNTNGIIDYSKIYGLEITTARGQVFSRKRIEKEYSEVEFEYTCYLGKFRPVYDPNGLFFQVEYKGNILEYHPEDDSILDDLLSNDTDVLKKAMNKVYQTTKNAYNKEKYSR